MSRFAMTCDGTGKRVKGRFGGEKADPWHASERFLVREKARARCRTGRASLTAEILDSHPEADRQFDSLELSGLEAAGEFGFLEASWSSQPSRNSLKEVVSDLSASTSMRMTFNGIVDDGGLILVYRQGRLVAAVYP